MLHYTQGECTRLVGTSKCYDSNFIAIAHVAHTVKKVFKLKLYS